MTISPFTNYRLTEVLPSLEVLVEKMRAGMEPMRRVVIVIERPDGEVDYKCFGEEPFNIIYAIGMCNIATTVLYDASGDKEEE